MESIGNKLNPGRLLTAVSQASNFILDLIFPKQCFGCKREGVYLCQQCFEQIALNEKIFCVFCKKESALGLTCSDCSASSMLNAVWLSADYNNEILQALVHNLKYNYITELSRVLAALLIKYLEQAGIFKTMGLNASTAILVPVPLHRKRYLARGFNQSALLAEQISEYYKIPKLDLLERTINTKSQVDLKRGERQQNVKDAFIYSAKNNLDKNKKIILIDDVVTTGSTLTECARVLKQEGFNEIYGLVLAQRGD